MNSLDRFTKEELALALYIATAQLNVIKLQFVSTSNTVGAVHRSQVEILKEILDSVPKVEYPEYCLEIFGELS